MQHRESHHNSDFDDVALCYVDLLKSPNGGDVVRALKQDRGLRDLLIEAMEKGWTSSREKDAIAYLRSL